MKTILFSGLLVAFLSLTACQEKDNNNNGQPANNNVATTPTTAQCNLPGSTNCNPAVYGQHGWQTYPWNYSNGFCGCPSGYRPVMSPSFGFACAPAYEFNFQVYYYQGYRYTSYNNQWTNIPQVSYSPAISGTNNCYSQAIRSCDVQASDCGSGSYCRPVGGGTRLGICTVGSGTETYYNPVNPYYVPYYYPGYSAYQQPHGRNCHYYSNSIFQGWYCYSYNKTSSGPGFNR